MILRKLLITFSLVCFLFTASVVYADGWYNQLPDRFTTFENVEKINVKFLGKGSDSIVTFYMRDGSCMQFLVKNDNIVSARKCGDGAWLEYRYPEQR
jgi:hypothetical protein